MNLITKTRNSLKFFLPIIRRNFCVYEAELKINGHLDNYSFCEGWSNRNSEVLNNLIQDFRVVDNFISEQEEKELIEEIDPQLWKMKYQFDHWDDAIHGFRETEKIDWSPKSKKILSKVRNVAFSEDDVQMKQVHILDLAPNGYIKPHVDAVKFCGSTISGMSLLSDCVMRLVHDYHKHLYADILLRRRSLYVMKDTARYDFTHEILREELSKFKGSKIPRERRISIICRCSVLRDRYI